MDVRRREELLDDAERLFELLRELLVLLVAPGVAQGDSCRVQTVSACWNSALNFLRFWQSGGLRRGRRWPAA